MKSKAELNLPNDRRYTNEHVWIKRDGSSFLVGIGDYAQDQLGEVAYVDLPSEGNTLEEHDEFGSIKSVKAVNALYMPVKGEILEINANLEDAPETVNADCYGAGWLVKIAPANAADVEKLNETLLNAQQNPLDYRDLAGCGACQAICPHGAIKLSGQIMETAEILKIVLEDKAFYESTGGGATLGGGESLAQPDAAMELLRACKQIGIHTDMETCGFASRGIIEKVAPYVDLFLYDIKHTDGDVHFPNFKNLLPVD